MKKLNFPEYNFKFRQDQDIVRIFDPVRRKYVALTPEEWVRQHMIMYLAEDKKIPLSLIAVEAGLKVFKTSKRTDLVVYGTMGKPLMVVECKSPEVKVTQQVFDQVVRYNLALKVPFIAVTNGLVHLCCHLQPLLNTYEILPKIPDFEDLNEKSLLHSRN
jgi:hypothetical protein